VCLHLERRPLRRFQRQRPSVRTLRSSEDRFQDLQTEAVAAKTSGLTWNQFIRQHNLYRLTPDKRSLLQQWFEGVQACDVVQVNGTASASVSTQVDALKAGFDAFMRS
jgi:hypothetical protein